VAVAGYLASGVAKSKSQLGGSEVGIEGGENAHKLKKFRDLYLSKSRLYVDHGEAVWEARRLAARLDLCLINQGQNQARE
jgi:hypothetical protein